jgi:hypothetical protein
MRKFDKIEDPQADLVTVGELARRFNIDSSNARKWLIKEGFKLRFIRLPEARNQLCAALNRQETKAAIMRRRELGFRVNA